MLSATTLIVSACAINTAQSNFCQQAEPVLYYPDDTEREKTEKDRINAAYECLCDDDPVIDCD